MQLESDTGILKYCHRCMGVGKKGKGIITGVSRLIEMLGISCICLWLFSEEANVINFVLLMHIIYLNSYTFKSTSKHIYGC